RSRVRERRTHGSVRGLRREPLVYSTVYIPFSRISHLVNTVLEAIKGYKRKDLIVKNYIKLISIAAAVMVMAAGCGEYKEVEEPFTLTYDDILPEPPQPVIVRDELNTVQEQNTEQTETVTEEETVIVPFADRTAQGQDIIYNVEASVFEEGIVSVEYPQLTGMVNAEVQRQINENIKRAVAGSVITENLRSYEMKYETATKGSGIVSFIFRGTVQYENSAHPDNIVKTLNIQLDTGKNVRLKDFSDIAGVVSCLELADGYTVKNSGVDKADFSAFLNNGSVTDYAMTLLDFDIDFENLDLIPAGFSAVRDNHLVLFIEAEHAMGDYVEIEFDKNL
ncbi:MAG: DUF4163 domain-containing protein, partial [Lachnospiraceae bacterium]|nr:DUF4163 domain-containing protein [Lachnospiraceae bacterium]